MLTGIEQTDRRGMAFVDTDAVTLVARDDVATNRTRITLTCGSKIVVPFSPEEAVDKLFSAGAES